MNLLHQLVMDVATRHPEKAAIIEDGKSLSYSGLQHQVYSLSNRLRGLGIKPGDSVALFLPNSAEFVVSFFAIAQAGAVVVPLNPHYQNTELSHFIADSGASAVITTGEFQDLCCQVLDDLAGRCALLVLEDSEVWENGSALPGGQPNGRGTLSPEVSPQDYVIFQHSSGSTGKPKRIARSHANLVFELGSLANTLGLTSDDRFLGATPFSHVNGLVRSMLASMSVGATLYPLRDFKRQKAVNTIQQEGITVFIGVPFMFSILGETNFRQPVDLSSIRHCISASAPMPVAANQKFQAKYGLYVHQLYGSTETGTISVNTGPSVESTLESVGHPIEGVEVAVFQDDGTPAGVGETGELAVKSPAAITRYHSAPEDASPFRDGYFLTGDVGRIDEQGCIYLMGRKKFFINKGGYKINPAEVETLIEGHPKVKEVVVVGVQNSLGDETVKAVIVPDSDCSPEEVINFCRGKLADFKVPGVVEFRQSLPKTATGKVLRGEL